MSKQYDHHWKKGLEKDGDKVKKKKYKWSNGLRKKKRHFKPKKPKSLPMSTIVYRIEPKDEGGAER